MLTRILRPLVSRPRRNPGRTPDLVRLAGIGFGLALSASATLAEDLDAASWQRIQAQVEAQVDAEFVAGEAAVGRGGLTDLHGLVRTGIVAGDFTDLPPQDAEFGPEFGYSVAQQDDWLIVGAPGAVTTFAGNIGEHGALFVFRREGGAWVQKQMLTRPGDNAPRCGHSVALRLPHLMVGCPDYQNDNGPRRGVLHRWKLQGDSFVLQHTRYFDGDEARCGYAVAMSRNYQIIGCPNANNEGGRVYIFKRNTVDDEFVGEPEATITGSSIAGIDTFQFGAALALFEPPSPGLPPFNVRLAIGAPNTIYDGSIFPRGTVHLYHRALDQPTWSANTTLTLSEIGEDGNALASFGDALTMNRDQLVVGAPNNRFGALQTLPGPGSVHRYEYTNIVGTVYQWQAREAATSVNLPEGPHSAMRFGESVAIGHDNLIAIGAPATDGTTIGGNPAEDVGLLELRRTANGDWSVLNYQGELRPAPLNAITRHRGRFGQALSFDVSRQRLAAGYPRSGSTLVGPGQPNRPRGAVWIYETDEIFADGFQ